MERVNVEIERDIDRPRVWFVTVEEETSEYSCSLFDRSFLALQGPYDSLSSWNEALQQYEFSKARTALMKKLARQALHSAQAEQWLIQSGVSQRTIDALLQECWTNGWFNDEVFLNGVTAYQKRRGRGPRAIADALNKRGIKADLVSIEASYPPEERREAIRAFLEKQGKKLDLTLPKNRKKTYQALLRKGFTGEEIGVELNRVEGEELL